MTFEAMLITILSWVKLNWDKIITIIIAVFVYRLNSKINKLGYQKPYFKIIKMSPVQNYHDKESVHPHIILTVFNPASFENTVYLSITNMWNKDITKITFYPKESIHSLRISPNSHEVHLIDIYQTAADKYKGKLLKLIITDSKRKKSSRWFKFKSK